jgi:hypothetical protein
VRSTSAEATALELVEHRLRLGLGDRDPEARALQLHVALHQREARQQHDRHDRRGEQDLVDREAGAPAVGRSRSRSHQ